MADRIDLDHVALAFENTCDGFDRYRGDLGGDFVGGGIDPGFYWGQVRFANGMRLEMLEPAHVTVDDFLRRFLDRNGPGPHHLTFKVPDITVAIDAATEAGYPPVRVNLEWDEWKEAFLHPKSSHGVVVQLAQAAGGEHPSIDGLPPSRAAAPAALERIVHTVADIESARGLFEGVLEGRAEGEGADERGRWVDLAWPGPGRLRLLAPAPRTAEHAWLGARPGRIHHLAFALTRPELVPRAVLVAEGEYEVAPEHNFGTRLRVHLDHPASARP